MYKLASLGSLLFLAHTVWAGSRDCVSTSSAPLCPNSGATILDETYPTQTFVVSMKGYANAYTKEPDEKLPADFITSILGSYTTDKPEIIVPGTADSFQKVLNKVKENLTNAKLPPEYIDKQLSLIKHVENQNYTWQQDYFESFISPTTGRPVVREIESYSSLSSEKRKATLEGLKSSSSDCSVEVGLPLKDFSSTKGQDPKVTSWGNGEMGGNIEGLPGGLCLKGNNQAEDFVSQYCGPKESGNFVEIDVGWMMVGHVDEVIKVVPTDPKNIPIECNFTVWVASPDKGIEALKQPEFINRSFIDLTGLSNEEGIQKINDIISSKAGKKLCSLLEGLIEQKNSVPAVPDGKKVKTTGIWKSLIDSIIMNVHAGVILGESTNKPNCLDELQNVTNRQMVELMEKDEDFSLMNKLIQEKMNKNKDEIKSKMSKRLPQCKDIKFVDVPDLFYGYGLVEINGKKELPEPGNGRSLFPNPTNSVLANKTMIVSQAPNAAFNSSVKEALTNQGLKTNFVNTWNYAHAGDGNMHCSSHSLTYCKPRGQK